MVITAADLAFAMLFLALLEGFRRTAADDVVIIRWLGTWRSGGSPEAVWLREVQWLWIAPWHSSPRVLLLSASSVPPEQVTRRSVAAVAEELASAGRVASRPRFLMTIHSLMILLVLPATAIIASVEIIYGSLALMELNAILIAVEAGKRRGWSAAKYGLYPLAALFAVVDSTLEVLREYSLDTVLATLLPKQAASREVRKHYRHCETVRTAVRSLRPHWIKGSRI